MQPVTAPPTEYGFLPVGALPNITLHREYSQREEIKLAAENLAERLHLPKNGFRCQVSEFQSLGVASKTLLKRAGGF